MRWKPTRAGIFNVWEYDSQTFEFGDGRLALRGRNGSGKSNALALLFPFVLDGVMSAARMDPMGGGRSMKSLLLSRDDDDRAGRYRHDSGTGYVWMEFGNGEGHVTIGIGASATQHRDADPWFFVTSQRVGHDLELVENDTPLGRRQLAERITDGNVFQKADEYRDAVDRRLFGLGDSRYRRLVDLLLTLRRPHLAGKLDTEHLSATLSAGLGELDFALIDDVAHSFDDLDSMQHELEGLAASLNAVERFLPAYREHLVSVGRQRGRAVLEAVNAITELDRDRARARRELRAAQEAEQITGSHKVHAESERDRLALEIENILLSPAYQDATTLDEVSKSAVRARSDADRAALSSRGSVELATRAVAQSQEATAEASSRVDELAAAIAEWFDIARVAGIDAPSRSEFDNTWAASVITQRRNDVDQVKQLARQADGATQKARHAEEHAGSTLGKVTEAQRAVDTARAHLAAEQATLNAARTAWTADLLGVAERFTELDPDQQLPDPAELWGSARSTTDDDLEAAADHEVAAFHAADRHVGEIDVSMSRSIDGAQNAAAAQQDRIEELAAERYRVEHEPNPGPPANPTRPAAADADRPGVPLYICVDFIDGLPADERAGLEAALGAAGILDALVTPDGLALDRLDAALDPLWSLGIAVEGPSLADVLVPVAVNGLTSERIQSVLRAIPLAGDFVTVGMDGSWRMGPVVGRYSQPHPLFIGHAARERRRAERLAALDAELVTERASLGDAERHLTALTTAREALQHLRSTQPPTKDLAEALSTARDWLRRLDERLLDNSIAVAAAEATLRVAESISLDAQRTASRLHLPIESDGLQEIERHLSDCHAQRSVIDSMRNASNGAATAAERAAGHALTMQQRADDDRAAAEEAEAFARSEKSRYEQLSANVGGDAQRAVAALSTARAQHKEQEVAVSNFTVQLATAAGNVIRLTERIGGFDHRQGQLDINLATATRHFDVICSAEIADVIAVEGVDATADRQVAAKLLLAGTNDLSDDVSNRMEKVYREVLLDGLRAGHDPSMPKVDNVDVVRVGTADGELPIGTLARQLRGEHERTSQLLSKQEREIFETHLLTRVGDAIRQLLEEADKFEHRINEEMSRVPTESGMIVELRWEPTGDEPELRGAIQALRTNPELLGPDRRNELRDFFMGRIADYRSNEPGRSFAETLTAVLDYRTWHQFVVYARFSSGKRQRVTRTFYRGLSGGEAATLLHLPLFAAAAAQYTNGSVNGPRLIALDEAFVGIDDKMRARLMGLLTQLDLDVILTSHEFWGFYDTVPALVLYDLVRRPPAQGVYAQRFDWVADTSSSTVN